MRLLSEYMCDTCGNVARVYHSRAKQEYYVEVNKSTRLDFKYYYEDTAQDKADDLTRDCCPSLDDGDNLYE